MEDQRDKVGQAVSPASEQSSPGLDQRKFLGALGATAAAALLGPEGAKLSGQSTSPPPVPSQQSPADPFMGPTYVTQGYNQPNILMIMVDQMGTPRWLPGPTLPHIANLQATSCILPNYCVASSACTPSRATLLTGLYSQQTCIFNTLENWCEPELLAYTGPLPPDGSGTGFPTIGNVLSQQLPKGLGGPLTQGYDTVWIGKWHASATGTWTSDVRE